MKRMDGHPIYSTSWRGQILGKLSHLWVNYFVYPEWLIIQRKLEVLAKLNYPSIKEELR